VPATVLEKIDVRRCRAAHAWRRARAAASVGAAHLCIEDKLAAYDVQVAEERRVQVSSLREGHHTRGPKLDRRCRRRALADALHRLHAFAALLQPVLASQGSTGDDEASGVSCCADGDGMGAAASAPPPAVAEGSLPGGGTESPRPCEAAHDKSARGPSSTCVGSTSTLCSKLHRVLPDGTAPSSAAVHPESAVPSSHSIRQPTQRESPDDELGS
jgi:hypothetical protein